MRIDIGRPMTLDEIAYATGGLKQSQNTIIKSITTDSREVEKGDLFIAIKGDKFDGADYVSEVKNKGGFVLSKMPLYSDILHPNGNDALISLATYYTQTLPYILYRIGITGSVGKTTTKEFLKILLSGSYVTHASKENLNNQIGMPMSILSAENNTQVLLMEMGMNHPGEISKLSCCLHPNIGIITNIGTAHIGNLGSRKNIAKAKLEITDGMDGGMLFVPAEESLLSCKKRCVHFSFTDKNTDYFIKKQHDDTVSIFKSGNLYTNAKFDIPGEHNLKCLLCATSVAIEMGLSPDNLFDRIPLISKDNIRQNVFYRESLWFYTDFYNASRESVLSFIKSAETIQSVSEKNLFLGDVLELGDMSDRIHFEIGKAISNQSFSNLFLFGNHISNVRLGAIKNGFPPDRIYVNSNTSDPLLSAIQIRQICNKNDMIFMKASRGLKLERILDCFAK